MTVVTRDSGRGRPCAQTALTPDYRLGELTPDEAAAFERHAAACPDCTEALAAFDRVAAAIRKPADLAAASSDLADRVLAHLDNAEAGRPPASLTFAPPPRPRARLVLAWAAGVLMLLGFGGLWLAGMRAGGPSTPAGAQTARARSAAWLRQAQRPDGGWSAGQDTFDVGVSGVALLALASDLRDGGTEADRAAIRRGVEFILSRQQTGGLFGPAVSAGTYNHGLATLAVLEASAVDGNARWRAAAGRAVACMVDIQDQAGGWSYLDQGDDAPNTSASVWPLLALLRADNLGFEGLRPSIERGLGWMRTTIGAGGLMGYHRVDESPAGHATLTAAGAFCLLKTGGRAADPVVQAMLVAVRGAAGQLARLGEPVDFYRAFFVAQALALAGDPTSREARSAINGRLLAAQTSVGDQAGSWASRDPWTAAGGPVYATALAALAID